MRWAFKRLGAWPVRAGVAASLAYRRVSSSTGLSGGAVATNDDLLAARLRAEVRPRPDRPLQTGLRLASYALEQGLFQQPALYPLLRQVYAQRALYERARELYHGLTRYTRDTGTSLSELSALLAAAQLEVMAARRARLEAKWALYDEALAPFPALRAAPRLATAQHGLYMYVMQAPDAAAFAAALWQEGVGAAHGPAFMPCPRFSRAVLPEPVASAPARGAVALL